MGTPLRKTDIHRTPSNPTLVTTADAVTVADLVVSHFGDACRGP